MTPVERDTPTEPVTDASTDVNQDKKVNKTDLLLVVTALGETPPTNPNFDVNADGTVNIADVLLVIEDLDDPVAAAAPALGETVIFLDPGRLAMQIDILRAESDGSMKYEHAIAFFQSLLAAIRPTETRLLANYPNPFNPETWIPYELATDTNVTLTIYNAQGVVIRTLQLGQQSDWLLHGSRTRSVLGWAQCPRRTSGQRNLFLPVGNRRHVVPAQDGHLEIIERNLKSLRSKREKARVSDRAFFFLHKAS